MEIGGGGESGAIGSACVSILITCACETSSDASVTGLKDVVYRPE